ncbi:MAG TPA: hypothetical protein VN181_11190, partial [Thermoanaerobaculia bacterium]|nr:hypothetical protein [Thermoanaerobaculia bacterium]
MNCPRCDSDRTRRGGSLIWAVYLVLIALAIPAVVVLHLNGAIVGGIVIAVIILAHLVIGQRV